MTEYQFYAVPDQPGVIFLRMPPSGELREIVNHEPAPEPDGAFYHCRKCKDGFAVPDGYEPSYYCDQCAQELIEKIVDALADGLGTFHELDLSTARRLYLELGEAIHALGITVETSKKGPVKRKAKREKR